MPPSVTNSVDHILTPVAPLHAKRAELMRVSENEQKIQNRVRLLKMEEEKINRLVSETKSRAEKIFEAKKRNEERYIDKMRSK
jgi:hypothetical protein